MKKALITGITGQDGSYLAELLLAKGYEVHVSSVVPARSIPGALIIFIMIRTAMGRSRGSFCTTAISPRSRA